MINKGKKVGFYTLGCKLNFSETSSIGRLMTDEGYEVIPFEEKADIYVINTCSVTENADKKCRFTVRQALRKSPDAFVVVIGCYAQLKPKEIASIKGVDLVLGAAEKFQLPKILNDLTKNPCGMVVASEISKANTFFDAYSVGDRTRSFLKIQDGCDYKCTFCTIPLARGASRSDAPHNVIENANKLALAGVKEIVLTGVNTGDYGKGLDGDYNFYKLIQQLDLVDGIDRFRISSIEPNLLSDEIIEFVAQSNLFVPHFHIPLQSGSNIILSLMSRRYKRELYASRVAKIKREMPNACIGVDIIVGFPGETDEYFLETYQFLNELDIAYLHVFTYSERENTKAITFEGIVPQKIREERNNQLRILSEKKRRIFYKKFVGQTLDVLFEDDKNGILMSGFTPNYLKVYVPFQSELVNTTVPVVLESLDENGYFVGKISEKVLI
jgi:threonylcarbamoyladenosine tRNA methylthiotransferase MtaB